jgi:hypothetical protein
MSVKLESKERLKEILKIPAETRSESDLNDLSELLSVQNT